MKTIKNLGLFLFLAAIVIFTLSLSLSQHQLTADVLQKQIGKQYHREMIQQQAGALLEEEYGSNVAFISALKPILVESQKALEKASGVDPAYNVWNAVYLPEGVSEWDYRMSDSDIEGYLFSLTKYSAVGLLPGNTGLFFLLSFILGALGALLYFLTDLQLIPGIKNNQIYDSTATRGVTFSIRMVFLIAVLIATAIAGIFKAVLPAILTVVAGAIIIFLIYRKYKKKNIDTRKSRTVTATKGLGWIGLATCIYFIGFYVLLYTVFDQ